MQRFDQTKIKQEQKKQGREIETMEGRETNQSHSHTYISYRSPELIKQKNLYIHKLKENE